MDVPDFGERVGAADVEAKLDRYVHASDSSDESQRKQFTAALSSAVLQAVMSAPRGALQGLVKAGRIALDEQHLLVWVGDADATQLFASRRWNGALLPASGEDEPASAEFTQAVAAFCAKRVAEALAARDDRWLLAPEARMDRALALTRLDAVLPVAVVQR